MTTSTNEYGRWLKGTAVLLVESSIQDAGRYQIWLAEAEASVMSAGLGSGEMPFSDGTAFDIAIVGHRVLDDRMLSLASSIRQKQPGCGVLLQSYEAQPELMHQVRKFGASFLSKGASKTDFMFAMSQLLDGGIPDVDMLVARAQRRWHLSRQQTRILYYNLWSCSNEEIAGSLGVSLNTVQEYQQKLRSKTGARAKDGYFRLLMEAAGRRAPTRAAGAGKRGIAVVEPARQVSGTKLQESSALLATKENPRALSNKIGR